MMGQIQKGSSPWASRSLAKAGTFKAEALRVQGFRTFSASGLSTHCGGFQDFKSCEFRLQSLASSLSSSVLAGLRCRLQGLLGLLCLLCKLCSLMGRMPTCSKRTPKSCVGDFELAVGLAYDSTSALGCHYTAMVCVCVRDGTVCFEECFGVLLHAFARHSKFCQKIPFRLSASQSAGSLIFFVDLRWPWDLSLRSLVVLCCSTR